MIIFITHGDGPRGAERAVRNLLTDAPSDNWLSVVSMGKAFDVTGERLNERCVQSKAEAISAALVEIARGQAAGQSVTLCYVNGHMAVPFAAFALARLRALFGRPRTRLILWEHCVPHTHYERRSGLSRQLIRALYAGMLRMADAVVAPSSVIGSDLERHFGDICTTIDQIANPIVLAPATTLSLPVDWPAGTALRTVFVGALSPEKQPHLALDWVTANRGLGAHLLLCGEGPMRGELQARIDEQNLPATIAGHVGNLRAYYQQADLLISTSSYETFSNVMTEAALCGCQVLSTNWPGVSSVYGANQRVRIHREEAAPVFDLPLREPRPAPGDRLTNFDAAAHLQQLEGRT
ncbi:glycosyltransferase [Roseateles sp. PN1]|uniref:glycosyltransferase n=1 Tax=Roseateles sp. PN1 TaxID=3137372 RepID=UPI0031394586